MGMSASQARLLGLTARQSNLEYEGQQINQQRTSLSNQSANYYNSLLTLTVPTPPSTDDYTTVKYSFTIGGNDAIISQALPDGEGTYLVSYTTSLSTIGIQENSAYKTTSKTSSVAGSLLTGTDEATALASYNSSYQYYVQTINSDSNGTYVDVSSESGLDNTSIYFDTDGNQVDYATDLFDNGVLKEGYSAYKEDATAIAAGAQTYSVVNIQLADETAFNEAVEAGETIKVLDPNVEDGTNDLSTYSSTSGTSFTTVGAEYKDAFINSEMNPEDYYQYEASTGTRFAAKSAVTGSVNNSTLSITTFSVASLTTNKTSTLSGASIEFDSSGRISSMTDADGNAYTMTASTETDDVAYEDAYNQYTYDQYVYDQAQNEINANIEVLQAQDLNLELRLSQLNTEHTAIQTELDSVSSVLSANIESSFKTFNG